MKNEIVQVFDNEEFGKVTTLTIDGEPWFIGKEVAGVLGYYNTRKAISDHVDSDDKGVTEWNTPGGTQKLTIITESGLYSLIFSSKLPSAKKFKHWVTAEVIPALRKTGEYSMSGVKKLDNTEMIKPSIAYMDMVRKNPNPVRIGVIAKDYGMSAIKMNKILEKHNIQTRVDNEWIPNKVYLDAKYAVRFPSSNSRGNCFMSTKWLPAGRMFIYDLMAREERQIPKQDIEYLVDRQIDNVTALALR